MDYSPSLPLETGQELKKRQRSSLTSSSSSVQPAEKRQRAQPPSLPLAEDISNLPSELQLHIIAMLPTREVVAAFMHGTIDQDHALAVLNDRLHRNYVEALKMMRDLDAIVADRFPQNLDERVMVITDFRRQAWRYLRNTENAADMTPVITTPEDFWVAVDYAVELRDRLFFVSQMLAKAVASAANDINLVLFPAQVQQWNMGIQKEWAPAVYKNSLKFLEHFWPYLERQGYTALKHMAIPKVLFEDGIEGSPYFEEEDRDYYRLVHDVYNQLRVNRHVQDMLNIDASNFFDLRFNVLSERWGGVPSILVYLQQRPPILNGASVGDAMLEIIEAPLVRVYFQLNFPLFQMLAQRDTLSDNTRRHLFRVMQGLQGVPDGVREYLRSTPDLQMEVQPSWASTQGIPGNNDDAIIADFTERRLM